MWCMVTFLEALCEGFEAVAAARAIGGPFGAEAALGGVPHPRLDGVLVHQLLHVLRPNALRFE